MVDVFVDLGGDQEQAGGFVWRGPGAAQHQRLPHPKRLLRQGGERIQLAQHAGGGAVELGENVAEQRRL